MATDTEEITRQRLAYRAGRSNEERLTEATELIADVLESLKAEIAEMKTMLGQVANKK